MKRKLALSSKPQVKLYIDEVYINQIFSMLTKQSY